MELSRGLNTRWRCALLCLLLTLSTWAVFWRVNFFDFTDYDEFVMVVTNPIVRAGLTLDGTLWALTTSWFEYWHPLTWLSHMLDCQLFGLRAGWHHTISLLFHTGNTLLLFTVLRRITCASLRSAMVAALFALHPTHVESVAWIAERKDVLSTFFFLLTLAAYVRYVESLNARSSWAARWYWTSLILFGCALMSKPMVVTLPFFLLLLDYWPLCRFTMNRSDFHLSEFSRLLREKAPFFALSFAGCIITYFGVEAGGNLIAVDRVPWSLRLANVPISYARYIGKLFWPTNLVALYPMPSYWPLWQALAALLLLITISGLVLRWARSAPYLVFGWFTFLGILFPTIGFIQVGFHSIADRYTYVPFIGLFVALVWAIADFAAKWNSRLPLLSSLSALILIACGVLSWHQAAYWQNGVALWRHCLEVAPESVFARYNLGLALQNVGKIAEAMEQYRKVLQVKPDHLDANLNLGTAFILNNRMIEATNYFIKVLQLKPDYSKAHANMGLALRSLGDYEGAMFHCAEAIRLAPGEFGPYMDMGRSLSAVGRHQEAVYYFTESLHRNSGAAEIHYYLGLEFLQLGRLQEAASSLGQAIELAPAWPDAHLQLAGTLAAKGETSQAIQQYREALRLQPNSTIALNNLAWILATSPDTSLRNGPEAVRLAQQACERTSWKETIFIGTLAAAYAEASDFEKAVATSEKACGLAFSLGQTNLLQRNQELLRQFKNHEPCRQNNSALQSRL